ncbi:MAG TPA: DUF4062 domain-containing protein, partial [Thermoanaerobaculia bacterium]|nr:DUF4062 domain-containing protein [Thermoanaerobaculia bacterium]
KMLILLSGAPPAPWIALFLFLCAVSVTMLLVLSFSAMRHVYRIITRPQQYNGRLGSFVVYSIVAWFAWSVDLACMAVTHPDPGILASAFSTAATLFLLLAGICLHLTRMPRPLPAILITIALASVLAAVLHLTHWEWTSGHRAADACLVSVAFFLLGSAIYQILGHRVSLYAPFFAYFLLAAFYSVTWLAPGLLAFQGMFLIIALPGRLVVMWIWNRAIHRAVDEPSGHGKVKWPNELLPRVRVMVSSTTQDLTSERDAAAAAVASFGFEVLRAEVLGGVAASPRSVCIEMARNCDIFLLLIGRRYGFVLSDEDVSVTEMEFRTAAKENPNKILVYVARDIDREPRLQRFLADLEQFDVGYFRTFFTDPSELASLVTKDIARWLASRRPLSGASRSLIPSATP